MSLSVRPMTPDQRSAYIPLAIEGYVADIVGSGSLDEVRARAKAERAYAESDDESIYLAGHADIEGAECWVGVLGYELRGFDDDPSSEPALYVGDLEVFEPFRRRGFATALLQHAERLAGEAGAASVRLTVWAGNEGAHDLYARFGFRAEKHQLRMPVGPRLIAR